MNLLNGTNSKMNFELHASGYCVANASIVDPTSKYRKVKFYAVWAHIFHPLYGHILIDTGYNQQFYNTTRSFPERLYAIATPVTVCEGETAVSILKRKNVAASDVKYIFITHFHADHVCGLNDFPNANFVCSREALAQVNSLSGLKAVRKGIIKKLLPDNFASRVLVMEDIASEFKVIEGGLLSFRFFDSDDIRFIHLGGHARGMIGVFVNTGTNFILYAADAQWDRAVFDAGILPKKIVKLFFDSWDDFVATTAQLKKYLAVNPCTLLLFTHCPQTLKFIGRAL